LSKRVRFMRAMVMPRFGGPELFEERDVEGPEPGPGEVLVRVVVAGTNPVDTKLRADGSFAGLEPPVVLGSDASVREGRGHPNREQHEVDPRFRRPDLR
jgi:hypothetical protein